MSQRDTLDLLLAGRHQRHLAVAGHDRGRVRAALPRRSSRTTSRCCCCRSAPAACSPTCRCRRWSAEDGHADASSTTWASSNELFPLLIFVGIGAMTDFGPLLENPKMVLLGAAGPVRHLPDADPGAAARASRRHEAASIGIIGAIDGPTSIYVSGILAPHLLGPITVAAYSYMSLVPIIMPPIMRLLTTREGAARSACRTASARSAGARASCSRSS